MGWFNLFRARARRPKTGTSRENHRRLAAGLGEVRAQVLNLDAQLGTIHLALRKHEDEIAACKELTDRQSKALMRLEQLVNSPPAQPARYADPSVGAIMGAPARKLDIDQFSEQQKRLLAVFFQNRDRQMSYADVAAVLGKSAYTVKNQMNQIRLRADLFDCVIGPQSRNFFRLKDDLKVEKHLKVGRPIDRPVSMAESDRSSSEHTTAPTDRTF